MFCVCKILCLVDLKICPCLSRTKPWLELSIKFNQYSIKSFQKTLMGINNLWIHLVFNEYLCLKYLAQTLKWRAEQGSWEASFFIVRGEIVYSFFSFLFDIFQNSVYFDLWTIVLMYVHQFDIFLRNGLLVFSYFFSIVDNWNI